MTSLLQTGSKMKELEYALMTTEGSGLAQLPIHLVRIVAVDEDQHAWFVIPRPSQESGAFGPRMSAQLDFYKKGKPYYMSVQGEADLITATAEVPDTEALQSVRTMLWKGTAAAVRVKIETAEIFGDVVEEKKETTKGIGARLAACYDWLFRPVAVH